MLHSLTHRAQGAARARVRWQPYSSSVSTPTTYLNTPSTVTTSSPYSTPTPTFDSDRLKSTTTPSKDSKQYAIGLVDQAVKSLCEIWRPQDIPPVFLTTLSNNPVKNELVATPHTKSRNTQLPSPVSPTTVSSPPLEHHEPNCMFGARKNLVPIRGFVHEVLRRSRTSGCVLQTALCYLEAIRSKVPKLAEEERSGRGSKAEPDISDLITLATPTDVESDSIQYDSLVDTVKVIDNDSSMLISDVDYLKKSQGPSPPLTPLPPLPHPLLCPRRAFLAALILASKFTQDKCYSNRAWAKLSGLPPREIGRCERALGAALQWRLWVGKSPAVGCIPCTMAPVVSSRSLVRCQSESDLHTSSPTKFLVQDDPSPLTPVQNRGLRKHSTLPPNAFSNSMRERSVEMVLSPEMPLLSMMPGGHTQQLTASSTMAEVECMSCPPTELVNPCPSVSFSPCPNLSYSPSSTDSSSSAGDRTIQMSTLLDDSQMLPPVAPCVNPCTTATGSESWPWPEEQLVPVQRPSIFKTSPVTSILAGSFHSAQKRVRPPDPVATFTQAQGIMPEIAIAGIGYPETANEYRMCSGLWSNDRNQAWTAMVK